MKSKVGNIFLTFLICVIKIYKVLSLFYKSTMNTISDCHWLRQHQSLQSLMYQAFPTAMYPLIIYKTQKRPPFQAVSLIVHMEARGVEPLSEDNAA